jgi:hypothetical protein
MAWPCGDILTNTNIGLMNAAISYLMTTEAKLMNAAILDFGQNPTESEDH